MKPAPKMQVVLLAVLLAVCTSCTNNNPSSKSVSSSSTTQTPGQAAVSTMEPGQPFDATPIFVYFEACGRPCWLPLYPTPQLEAGNSVTKGYPCEYYKASTDTSFCSGGNLPGDKVHIVCQAIGNPQIGSGTLQNDRREQSNLWDKIELPPGKAVNFPPGLEPAPNGGFYAYGWDGWLGNTGDHHLPCHTNRPSITQTGPSS